jgi:hypothetical protein
MLESGKKKKQLWTYLMQKHSKETTLLQNANSTSVVGKVIATHQSNQIENQGKITTLLKGNLTSRNGL